MKELTRREFIKLSGTAAAAGLLAGSSGCAMLTPSVSREDVLKFHPDAPSKVVHTHHPGVWTGTPTETTPISSAADNALLAPEALREMLDVSITELTGLKEPRDAWALLFSPDERIAIKVNMIAVNAFSRTHTPLVTAVTECLQEVGIPAEQIVIFDRSNHELEWAGYQINTGDSPGVLCRGDNTSGYTEGWMLIDTDIKLSQTLLSCQALINMPILKHHNHSGITFAMKNHFGTFDKPGLFHGPPRTGQAIAELNALPEIRERTRLVIGDALQISPWSRGGWFEAVTGDSILMSFDPVAHDAVGLQVLGEVQVSEGNDVQAENAAKIAQPWLTYSTELGLGTNDPANIDLVEVNLG